MSWTEPILGGGNALIREEMKSPNFVSGVSGWSLDKDGDAEFNSVLVRGTVEATGNKNSSITLQSNPVGSPSVEILPADFSPNAHPQLDAATVQASSVISGPYGAFYGHLDLTSPGDGTTESSIVLSGGNGVSRIDVVATTVKIQGTLIDQDDLLYLRGQKGNLNITFASSNNFIQGVIFPVAFPVGVVPNVHPNINAAAGTTTKWGVRAYAVTNTGFNIWCTSGDGTSSAWAGVNVTWTAVV